MHMVENNLGMKTTEREERQSMMYV